MSFFALSPNTVMSHNVIRFRAALGAIALGATAAPPPTVSAQPANDPLGAIVAEAVQKNLRIAQERLAEESAVANARAARGRFLPSLSIASRYSDLREPLDLGEFVNPAYAALNQVVGENRFPTNLSLTLPFAHESRVRLTQPVFDASIAAGFSASRHARDGQHHQRRGAMRRIAAQAQTAYLDVATARSARKIWEATLELVTESERVATRLVDAGRATPDALFRARADRSDVEQRLAEARDQEDAASRAFNQLLRRPLAAPVEEIADTALRFVIRVTEEEAIARALERREELAQASAGVRAAEAGVRLATASFMPNVAVAVDYGFQGSALRFDGDDDFAVASIVLSWNVFNGGQDVARRHGAQADAERLRLRRAELEDLVRLDVSRAYRAAIVARDAIATADAGLAAARRNFELVRRRYEEGLASQIEFLDARTALTSAELNRVITVYRYAIRYVDLERASALREID